MDYTFYTDFTGFTGYSDRIFVFLRKIGFFLIAHIDSTTHII